MRFAVVARRAARLDVDALTPVEWRQFGEIGPVEPTPFVCPIADFYRTDPISRASPTMSRCSELFVHGGNPPTSTGSYGVHRTGTHG